MNNTKNIKEKKSTALPVSQELSLEGERLWKEFLENPFLAGIRDGSLDPEKFRFYMVQDYLYLIEYVRVFALGAAKAPDLSSMRYFEEYEAQILNVEMSTHRDYMKRLGISLEDAEHSETAAENQAYTDYMLARAWEGTAADIAVTVMACARSYEYLALELVRQNPACKDHPFYGEWVRSYADPEYGEANRKLEKMLDALTDSSGESDRKRYRKIFRKCSICEGEFWKMGWRGHI
ncbi:MAG: thiaminase II [Eubacteriales bacterium]|nr:thiaminase II [Eubacteriales bacterium]